MTIALAMVVIALGAFVYEEGRHADWPRGPVGDTIVLVSILLVGVGCWVEQLLVLAGVLHGVSVL